MQSPGVFCVGLTGGIGCGKSTVARLLADYGAEVIDTDLIAHQLTGVDGCAMPRLRQLFGAEAIAGDGSLNRGYMRSLVFSDPRARVRLEGILHPMIQDEVERMLGRARGGYVLLVVPLLVESSYFRSRCNRILAVECPPDVQVQRVMERSQLTESEVQRIIAAQAGADARRAIADELIYNAGSIEDLRQELLPLHQRLMTLAIGK